MENGILEQQGENTSVEELLTPENEQDEAEVKCQSQSLTLNSIPSKLWPKEDSACLNCPNAIWYAQKEEASCYCLVMRIITCSTNAENPLRICDGIAYGQDEEQ